MASAAVAADLVRCFAVHARPARSPLVEPQLESQPPPSTPLFSRRRGRTRFGWLVSQPHDSRALARVLSGEAFKAEFADRFAVTFIDVGKPQTGEGRNLDQIARFGVKQLKSTPAMFAIAAKGKAINGKKDALSWRNAESRGEAAVLAWLRTLAKR